MSSLKELRDLIQKEYGIDSPARVIDELHAARAVAKAAA